MGNKIDIKYDCHESWEDMPGTIHGRHCFNCEKEVPDFSGMSDEELKSFLLLHPTVRCGNFRADQITIRGRAPLGFFARYRMNIVTAIGFLAAKLLAPFESKAQDSCDVLKSDPDDLRLANHKKLYGDSTVFHIEGVVKRKGKRASLAHASLMVTVNGKRGGLAYTDKDGNFSLNVLTGNGGDKIIITVKKRKYKDVVIENVIADGKPLVIKMRKSLKRKFRREHYWRGKF